MEVSGNVLRIDDDNDEDDMSVEHMGQLFWGVWVNFARKILRQHPKTAYLTWPNQGVDEWKLFKL